MIRKQTGKLSVPAVILLVLLPLAAGLLCLGIGRVRLSPAEVFRVLLDAALNRRATSIADSTVINTRLPRVLLSLLCGAGLSVSGCAFQSLFANPLATPDTVGVASGASFGAALGILLGFGVTGIQGMSFLMGLLAVGLTWTVGRSRDRSLNAVVLAGIMIGSLFSALVSLVKFTADSETQLPAITYFLMGSFQGASYKNLAIGCIPVLAGMAVLFLIRWRMNLLPLSEDEVRSFGIRMKALRVVTVTAATVVTSSCVGMCGQVGWIGLLVPHMCRMAFKNNHLSLVPASISIGAAFMAVVDTAARSVSAQEIPVSVLTAVIGAPFFILLMRRTGGWKL
ncbi:MAG: iron ABC transporter permease [Lachnospiraceae bacterium]|nr:iron ABC transporter permease [Lachnospiraceae bacterium]